MATLTFKDIKKVYTEGADPAVDEFNLEIKDKEFVVFVGPSGCGKSTTLRMVAGLEDITAGELYIDDHLVNDVAPKNRDIAMVFQSYALYPHMTVYNNMAFGLKLRKEPRDQIDEKVQRAANILGLTDFLDRKPKALSGGQRQRVALGRAIVRNAKVFLMDEPLSNLDAKLRVQMRGEIIKLHKKIETTTIYVTHDQIEAMTMADRIVVMKDGFIQQVGAPKDIYDNPNNIFVGGFIGTPPMNFFKGSITEEGVFSCEGMSVQTPKKQMDLLKKRGYLGKEVIMGIRPEDIHDNDAMRKKHADSVVKFKVDVAELLGSETSVFAKVGDNDVTAMIDARADIEIGDELEMAIDMSKSHFFDIKSTERIK